MGARSSQGKTQRCTQKHEARRLITPAGSKTLAALCYLFFFLAAFFFVFFFAAFFFFAIVPSLVGILFDNFSLNLGLIIINLL